MDRLKPRPNSRPLTNVEKTILQLLGTSVRLQFSSPSFPRPNHLIRHTRSVCLYLRLSLVGGRNLSLSHINRGHLPLDVGCPRLRVYSLRKLGSLDSADLPSSSLILLALLSLDYSVNASCQCFVDSACGTAAMNCDVLRIRCRGVAILWTSPTITMNIVGGSSLHSQLKILASLLEIDSTISPPSFGLVRVQRANNLWPYFSTWTLR